MASSAQLVQGVIDRIGLPVTSLLFNQSIFTLMAWQQGAPVPSLAIEQAETLITCFDMIRDVDGVHPALRWILYGDECITSPIDMIAMGQFSRLVAATQDVVNESRAI